jgi:hypothetical protein
MVDVDTKFSHFQMSCFVLQCLTDQNTDNDILNFVPVN